MNKKPNATALFLAIAGMGINQPLTKAPTDQAREEKIQKCIKMIKFHKRKGNNKKVNYWINKLKALGVNYENLIEVYNGNN